jgi:hypothetical protein
MKTSRYLGRATVATMLILGVTLCLADGSGDQTPIKNDEGKYYETVSATTRMAIQRSRLPPMEQSNGTLIPATPSSKNGPRTVLFATQFFQKLKNYGGKLRLRRPKFSEAVKLFA